jgi:rare lipoprotein A
MLRAAKTLQQVPTEAWEYRLDILFAHHDLVNIWEPHHNAVQSARRLRLRRWRSTAESPPAGERHSMWQSQFYPSVLNGHKTASGETFHLNGHTAASNRLPLGTDVKVVNLRNGRSTQVKVNDRGPALGNHRIDLSKKAANEIGLTRNEGTAPVEIKVMRKPANHNHRTNPDSTTDSIEAGN